MHPVSDAIHGSHYNRPVTFLPPDGKTTYQGCLMHYHTFLDLEFNDSADHLFPTAIAWSLPNGQIKSVVITPEDEWLPDDTDSLTVDVRYLYEQGVPVLEILRELSEDLADQTVFVDGLDPDAELLEILFDALGIEQPFETQPITELIDQYAADALSDRLRQIITEQDLAPELAESTVHALLLLAQETDTLQRH